MSKTPSLLTTVLNLLLGALSGKQKRSGGTDSRAPRASSKKPRFRTPPGGVSSDARPGSGTVATASGEPDEAGRYGVTATLEVDPRSVRVTLAYAPEKDGEPDAGEIIWTWVPYEENDGRGKDRPVLVIGRASGNRYYAVRLTSKAHDGSRDYLPIGSGPWDSRGRESWVDIDQLYTVHVDGMRREAAILDKDRFLVVAQALKARWAW